MAFIILILIFFILMLISTPVGIGIGLSTLFVMEFLPGTPSPILMIKTLVTGANSFPLVAVPLFILAGEIMQKGGLSSIIVDSAYKLVGRFKAGLAYVNVLACMFFAAISGSSPATVAAIGSNMIPEMEKHGYRKDFSAALTSASGMLGVMIPPSIPLIIYGVSAGESLGELFLAGVPAGLIFGFAFMLTARISYLKNVDRSILAASEGKHVAFESKQSSIWALIIPVIILGGIYGGIFTPTEAAGVAVIYSLFISLLIYKSIKISHIASILVKAATTNATIMIMVIMATAFGRLLTMQQVPATITSYITSISSEPILILILINMLLLIVGMFMEPVAAIIILTPILLPIVKTIGVDPVHFGVIMTCNLAIGFCTPPIGINLFVSSSIAGVSVDKIMHKVLPYFFAMIISLLIITFIPSISLFLPSLM